MLPAVVPAYAALLFLGPSMTLAAAFFRESSIAYRAHGAWSAVFRDRSGDVVGALIVASLGILRTRNGWRWARCCYGPLALAVFGWSGSLRIAVPALFILGADAERRRRHHHDAAADAGAPGDARPRMSLNTLLIMCIRPLGDFPAGAVIGWLGFRRGSADQRGVGGCGVISNQRTLYCAEA